MVISKKEQDEAQVAAAADEKKKAAEQTLAEAKLAAELKVADAILAADLKLADAKVAAKKEVTDFYKMVVLPIVLAALVATPGIIAALRSGDISDKVEVYSKRVDGMKDELVSEVRKNARAEGVEAGKDEAKEK